MMKTEEENTCEINESVSSSSETITSTAAALNVAIANDREEQEKEVKEEDVGPEYFQFQCALCSFDVRARYGDLKIGKLGYQGKVYYTRSPFREFDRTKKVTLRDYVIVGSKCCQCSRDICVKIQCSFFYELNYCVTCIMQNRGNFPAKVIEKSQKYKKMNAAAKLISSTLKQSNLLLQSAKPLKKSLEIEWADGLKAEFPYCWLRDVTSKRPALVHLDVNTRPELVEVQQSRDSINVLWPSFVSLSYSSSFLRDNAIHNPSTSASVDHSNDSIEQPSAANQILQGKLFLSTHQTSITPSLIMGQCEWNSSAQEPGTLWPHYESIPSVCVVDALSTSSTMIPAELTLIDTFEVLSKMSEKYPKEFEFLRECKLEYSDGLFQALHPIYDLNSSGTQILSATFNNTSRSSVIKTPCLETLYISLQKFGRVSAECSKTISLFPGRRLIVDNRRAMLGCPAQASRRVLLRFLN